MATDTGVNLLAPGKTPKTNLMFLTFFVNTIKAVHDYADLLRYSIASPGNDFRLGANEAPPAIISIFIGKFLSTVLNEIESRVDHKFDEQDEAILKLDLHRHIPELLLDNTDRNRTSPFAFTGNKFEFRAVGSSANCASAMTVLNSILATTLAKFKKEVDELIDKGEKKEIAILQVLRKYISSSKNILFEGDNYSEDWTKEAERRKLPNIRTTPLALDAMAGKKAKEVFIDNHIFSDKELEARHEIQLEEYIKKVQIEARIIGYLSTNHILPAAIQYQNVMIENVRGLKEVGLEKSAYKAQLNLLNIISNHIQMINDNVEAMIQARKKANDEEDMHKRALMYCHEVKPYFDTIRYHADKLELIGEDKLWPLPKYRELLFVR